MPLFHDKAASMELPTYIMRQPLQTPSLATSKNLVSGSCCTR